MLIFVRRKRAIVALAFGTVLVVAASGVQAQSVNCPVTHGQLRSALIAADQADETGLNNHFWAVVVNRQGVVCAVAFSGSGTDDQWLLSRQIAAAKAFTANGLSLDNKPISTGALYSFVLPIVPQGNPSPNTAPSANPLFGLNGGNVLDSDAAYAGSFSNFGTSNDPMIGKRVGGTITFGGGLGLYQGGSNAVGGLGLSGDTACADHSTAWLTRKGLGLAPTATFFDPITLSPTGHPHCPNDTGTQGTT